MNSQKAVLKRAIKAIEAQRQKIAPEANIARLMGGGSPYMQSALEKYDQMTEDIKVLQEMITRC